MRDSRKLATIVFADIAGYSAMMQADEERAMVTIDQFEAILEKEVPSNQGEIVQYFGDGALLAFESATDALQASIALQEAFLDAAVPVRIGMHLGDVLYKNNNVFGDGVNIASRVESLGIPGSVLLSKTVRDQVKNKVNFSLSSLGTFHFKNITEKMEVFAVDNPRFAIPRPDQMRGKLEVPKKPQVSPAEKREWERYQMLEIMDAIEEGRCVLIMGHYAFSRPDPASGAQETEVFLPEILQAEQQKLPGAYAEEERPDFFTAAQSLIAKPGGKRKFMKLADIKLNELGKKQQERFKLISEIPFDLILSTYPFDLLHEAFSSNRITHQYDYYSYLHESADPEPFDAAEPLIYNLFGSTRHKESMVISLERLYQFIFAVLGARQLPKLIQDKVQQATHLVFMGTSFDDWYMKLLLRVLKVHEKDISYAHTPGSVGLRAYNQSFFESNFHVTFLNKKIDSFVKELYASCMEEGILRKKAPKPVTEYHTLRTLVSKYRLEEALDRMDSLLLKENQPGRFLRELGDYYRAFHKIKEWETYERYSPEELEEKWQTLRNNLFALIDKVETQVPA
ncbi:MAG: adenylate/guanylate cyclase domain-containing protein [Bacteroidota bacterium]